MAAEMTPRYCILRTAFDRLLDAIESDGPAASTSLGIAAEVRSVGITANCMLGRDPKWYADNPEQAVEYCLGQLLSLIDRWSHDGDNRLIIAISMINIARRFQQELLPPLLAEMV